MFAGVLSLSAQDPLFGPALFFISGLGLFTHGVAEAAQAFPKGVIVPVGVSGEFAALQVELARLIQILVVHLHRHDVRQEHIVGAQGHGLRDLAQQADGALGEHWQLSAEEGRGVRPVRANLLQSLPERTPQKSAAYTMEAVVRLMENSPLSRMMPWE